ASMLRKSRYPALRRYEPLQPCDDDRLCSWLIDDSAWTFSTTAIHLSPIPCNARAPSARFTPKKVERLLRFTYITNLDRLHLKFALPWSGPERRAPTPQHHRTRRTLTKHRPQDSHQ